MRLPYIQVTQETWERAEQISLLLICSVGDGFKLQADLYRWGLSLGPEDQPPAGICDSPRAARLMAAALHWPLDRAEELKEALLDLGLIELLEVGLRVKGTDRYHAAWKRNRRQGHGRDDQTAQPSAQQDKKAEVPPLSRAEPAVVPRGKTGVPERQTQTQTQTKETTTARKSSKPEFEHFVQRLAAEFRLIRSADLAMDDADRAQLRKLREKHADPEILMRWRRGLHGKYARELNSVGQLANPAKWNALATADTGSNFDDHTGFRGEVAPLPPTTDPLELGWRDRLSKLRESGQAYVATQLQQLRADRLEGTDLVVTTADPFFAEWCIRDYLSLLPGVRIEHRGNA